MRTPEENSGLISCSGPFRAAGFVELRSRIFALRRVGDKRVFGPRSSVGRCILHRLERMLITGNSCHVGLRMASRRTKAVEDYCSPGRFARSETAGKSARETILPEPSFTG